MRLFSLASTLVLLVAASASGSAAKSVALQRCSVIAVPSTCPNGQYCITGKPYNHCTKKLDGGKECTKDEACKSDICFIAKQRRGKRVCAPLPLSNYPLGAQCTQSKQCKSKFCDKGYCKKPVAAGESCPKESGCAELSEGAHCLQKAETFVVYSSAGKKQTKKLSAGHCSYISNLGEGMKCTSNANCFGESFTCSKTTRTCTAIAKPPAINLPYQSSCSADSQCSSDRCLQGKCGCEASGSDCKEATQFCNAVAVCQAKLTYGKDCDQPSQCTDKLCVSAHPVARSLAVKPESDICGCSSDSSCDSTSAYCDLQTNLCGSKRSYNDNCSTSNQCLSNLCLSDGDFTCGCSASSECSGSDVCDRATNTCIAPPSTVDLPYKEPCSSDGQCSSGSCVNASCGCSASGSDCDPDTEYCSAGATCKPKLTFGDTCVDDDQCTDNICLPPKSNRRICGCSMDASCGPNEFCNLQNNMCLNKKSYGVGCSSSNQCRSNLCFTDGNQTCGCSDNSQCPGSQVCGSSNTCVAPTPITNLPYQEPCTSDNQCASGSCPAGKCACHAADCDVATETCNAAGLCEVRLRLYGETCETEDQCADGICHPDTSTGIPRRPYVCACAHDASCPSDQFCNADVQMCQVKSAMGYRCFSDSNCRSGHCNLFNLDDPDNGGSCGCDVNGDDCDIGSQFCDNDATCKQKLSFQAPCEADGQCSSGACNSKQCACAIDGSDCDVNTQFCSLSHLCTAKLLYSAECGDNKQCLSGRCDDEACGCSADPDCSSNSQYCESDSHTCMPLKPYDAQCSRHGVCASGFCPDYMQTCQCIVDQDCASDMYCMNPHYGPACFPKAPTYDQCSKDSACLSGHCLSNDFCGCGSDDDCGVGSFCDGDTHTCKTLNLSDP